MPTNILRNRAGKTPTPTKSLRAQMGPRRIVVKAGSVTIRAELLDTPTADRIWAALPIYSTAETWGDSIHFETPIETGRERGARSTSAPGEIALGARMTG